jgi:hypothetical protein
MSLSIDQAFVSKFETEVKVAYQRVGSKLSNTMRRKTGIRAKQTTFFKAGAGTAGTKTRHGMVPLMNVDHAPVVCTLADFYAADYVDKLDELKADIDERKVLAEAGAGALGRKMDDIVTTAMNGVTTNVILNGSTGLTEAKCLTVFEQMGTGNIPSDGMRYFVIPPQGWTDLLAVASFADADYVGADDLPWKGGMVARRWLDFMFMTHSGLPTASNVVSAFAYHGPSVGVAIGAEVTTETNYVPERVAHLITSYMSMGACVIDEQGVWKVGVAI